jgi:hypothetical protein
MNRERERERRKNIAFMDGLYSLIWCVTYNSNDGWLSNATCIISNINERIRRELKEL